VGGEIGLWRKKTNEDGLAEEFGGGGGRADLKLEKTSMSRPEREKKRESEAQEEMVDRNDP